MADNYLEKQYEDYQRRKAAAENAKRRAWQKSLKAYREQLKKQQEENK